MRELLAGGLRTFRRRWSLWRSKTRFTYDSLDWEIAEGVVNPTLFTASKVFARQLLRWLPDAPVEVLELGCGSGFAGLLAAKRGHSLTGLDIDPGAVACAKANAKRNHLAAVFLESDWDKSLAKDAKFERIVCNPPFLQGVGGAYATALKAGQNWEVLTAMVKAIDRRLAAQGRALVMTSSQTDRQAWLKAVASVSGLRLVHLARKRHWQEWLLFDELTSVRSDEPVPAALDPN